MIFLDEERFLEEAVRSVLDQTLTDWELILVDDGSSDRSPVIARGLAAADERIGYVDHEGHVNRGMAASRNAGVAQSNGRYVAFLDADDVWVPEKLAEQVAILENSPDVALVCGSVLNWWSWDTASGTADSSYLIGGVADCRLEPPEAALAVRPLGNGATGAVDLLIRRSALEAVGGFEEGFTDWFEDQSLYLKVFLRYPVYISSRIWLLYRQHDASHHSTSNRVDYLRVQRVFFRWLKDDIDRYGDPRVEAAFRRAIRRNRGEQLKAQLKAVIPDRYKPLVKRALSRVAG